MASTSGFSTWPVMTAATGASPTIPSVSSTLNFLAAVASGDVEQHDLKNLAIDHMDESSQMDERTIGKGGSAIIELGKLRLDGNRVVAIKRLRFSKRDADADADFETHLQHICLELRILCHPPLRAHKNIVDIVGYCMSEVNGFQIPFLGLVLEHSGEGSLKSFLSSHKNDIPSTTLWNLAAQVADGLGALHRFQICHGDVKLQNTLVFRIKDSWVVKISDFGESLVGHIDDPSLPIKFAFGTILLNAPETRNDKSRYGNHVTITDAIRTDIFSFGLLTWEVMKRGESYFDRSWLWEQSSDLDDMEMYLDSLPHNRLLSKAIEFVRISLNDLEDDGDILKVFQGSLQDDPGRRASMDNIRGYFARQNHPTSTPEPRTIDEINPEPLSAWGNQHTLLQFTRNISVHNTLGLLTWPDQFKRRISKDLTAIADTEVLSSLSRGHAAMCVAECYVFGFGLQHSKEDAVIWMQKASELGYPKAVAWYPRMCSVTGVTPVRSPQVDASIDFEKRLSKVAVEDYLLKRIQLQVIVAIQNITTAGTLNSQSRTFGASQYISRIGIFSDWDLDDLLPIHLAALLGDEPTLSTLIHHGQENAISSQGFTALHYASIGGHFALFKLLLQHASVTVTNSKGITPLHLCIFFPADSATQAASLLLEKGANASSEITQPVEWEFHDICLEGTALDWATRTRHKSLVDLLMPFAEDDQCLHIAVGNFFWEIAELILQYFKRTTVPGKLAQELSPSKGRQYITTIDRPFAHWLAHGADHRVALERTAQVCKDNQIDTGNSFCWVSLADLISLATFEDDFALVECCATMLSPAEVKRPLDRDAIIGTTALEKALENSKNLEVWRAPLKTILNKYTIEELDTTISLDPLLNCSWLQHAVRFQSVIGTQLLLEKGVDVNYYDPDSFMIFCMTPLALADGSKDFEEIVSILIKHGAKVGASLGLPQEIASLIHLGSGPNKDFLKTSLKSASPLEIPTALRNTMLQIIHDRPDNVTSVGELFDDLRPFNGRLTIKLGKEDLDFVFNRISFMSLDDLTDLAHSLGKEQCYSLFNIGALKPAQRPESYDLNFVVEVVSKENALLRVAGVEERDPDLIDADEDRVNEVVTSFLKMNLQIFCDALGLQVSFNGVGAAPTLIPNLNPPEQTNPYIMELFQMQLSLDNWIKHINFVDKHGKTLIFSAAEFLRLDLVLLLLEAGADAGIPLTREGKHNDILPLQVACILGRLRSDLRRKFQSQAESLIRLPQIRAEHSLEVASTLLEWHHARPNGLFQGITKLHLAYRMKMSEDVINDLRMSGYHEDATGHWPGIERPVICSDLRPRISDDDYITDEHT